MINSEKWDKLLATVHAHRCEGSSWKIDKNNIIGVIRHAAKWGIQPPTNVSISNLRTLLKQARNAVKDGDRNQLTELFALAEKLPNAELRLQLGRRVTPILVDEVIIGGNLNYKILLTATQFDRVRKNTSQFYKFIFERSKKNEGNGKAV